MRALTFFTLLPALVLMVGLSLAEGGQLHLKVESFDPVAHSSRLPGTLRWDSEPASGVFLVQFGDAAGASAVQTIREVGGEPLGYVPTDAYLTRLPTGGAERIRTRHGVRWVGAVEPGWKISPDLGRRSFQDPARRGSSRMRVVAELFSGADAESVAALAQRLGAEVIQVVRISRPAPGADVMRIRLRASRSEIDALAHLGDVAWIEEEAELMPRNDDSAWVLQSNVVDSWTVWDHQLHGQGQIIGLIDEPIDMNSCFFRDEADNTPGPGHRKVIAYRSSSGIGAAEHGTHVAGTLAGDPLPEGGTGDGGGMAPAARISFGSLWDISGSGSEPSNLYQALSDAHADGARIHSNSWGDDGTNAYTTWSRDIDMFSYDFEDSLVVQAGTNLSSGRSPENAKNGLTVSASKRGTQANYRCLGTIGPTIDGRRKPEVLAPGCTIISARALYACSTFALDGTSMATPAVAGVGALVRQYYEEGWYPTGAKMAADSRQPSGALVKATLLNSTVDMTGEPGYPTDKEGWGRPLIENALYFEGDTRRLSVIADVWNADGLVTGQVKTFVNEVNGGDAQLKITLVWTEPPAEALAAEATINDLDLKVVSPSGVTYLGNVIDTDTGFSVTGGFPDPRNNVEMVIVPQAEAGSWTASVTAAAVNQGTQGFALVASGDIVPYLPYPLEHESYSVQDDPPLGNLDGVVDPGETVVMPESLRNTGDEAVSSVSGELRTNQPGLVKITRASASYPDIPSGTVRSSNAPHYRYTVSPDTPCGTRLQFDIALSSSAGNGQVSFSLDVGCQPLDCPQGPAPTQEVTGLLLDNLGAGDLRLSWNPLGDAAGYRVWKSANPQWISEHFVDSTTQTELIEPGGAVGPENWFYVVRGTNSCEWEGP